MIASAAQASELYTEQLTISNKTPYLRITIPPENKEMTRQAPPMLKTMELYGQ
ncbi:hypothetical protein [Legionella sp. km772]|uniref:hypothetical protein n=1 Tax=Legionella sp. km772 TaxID=2498111 RepID=UPI0013152E1D|nr:hypothetical protein [Legionella sp. km772]